ncbi:MAG: pseudaminic acid cytidylyltransferase [Bacteroidetes bacterium]|nr:pseudaminic acid cytidylyltransferase [Bacteroidota bacterium]
MKNIAIITARGGSKRIPRKNIKPFLGKPIIAYSIETAINSGLFDEVMVSTDDVEIAEISKSYGANVPFLRSLETSSDFAKTNDVLLEVFEGYRQLGKTFHSACCIYPTAPFISVDKLTRAYRMLIERKANLVLPIAKFSVPIWWALNKDADSWLSANWPDTLLTRSQDLQETYYDAGQFYFFNVASFLNTKSLYADKYLGIELPELEVQDIDNESDWKIAEMKYSLMKK